MILPDSTETEEKSSETLGFIVEFDQQWLFLINTEPNFMPTGFTRSPD